MTTTHGAALKLSELRPGYQRDGGYLAAKGGWSEGVWARFYNGRPQRLEGVVNLGSQTLDERILKVAQTGDQFLDIYVFSKDKVYVMTPDRAYADITPSSGWDPTNESRISVAAFYKESVNKNWTIYCKHRHDNATPIFYHEADAANSVDTGVTVKKGGVIAVQPYLLTYDIEGQIKWSNADDPANFGSGDAGSDYLTDKPFIQALPGPKDRTAYIWTENELWKAEYVGGSAIFSFSKLVEGFNVLDPDAIIRHGSRYYWPGTHCFYMFDGRLSVVPNTQNAEWFFKSVSTTDENRPFCIGAANHSWAELWWAFELDGASDEWPSRVICMDVKAYERTGTPVWWDFEMELEALAYADRKGGATDSNIVFGSHVSEVHRLCEFSGSSINDNRTGSSVTLPSSITTGPISLPADTGQDIWLKLRRIEPSMQLLEGDLDVDILTRKYAQGPDTEMTFGTISASTEKLDESVEGRHMRVKFYSNRGGEKWEMGEQLLYLKPSGRGSQVGG